MNSKQFHNLLIKLEACSDAVEFSKGKSLQQAWESCERSNWMLWLLGKQLGEKGWPDKKVFLLTTVDFAQTAMKYWKKKFPEDDRPQKCLDTVVKYCQGKATIEEVASAGAAAGAARAAAWEAARAAAGAAAEAARAAAWDARDAAWEAARAAEAAAGAAAEAAEAAAGAAAGAAAWDAAHKEMCGLIRKRIPKPFYERFSSEGR